MIQSKKLFVILSGIASLSLGAAVVFSVSEKNIDSLRGNADNTPAAGSITFDRTSTASQNLGSVDHVFESTTSINGNKIYMKSFNNSSSGLGKDKIAYFEYNTNSYIQFFSDEEATKPYSFQNLSSIVISNTMVGSYSKITVYTQSLDGVTFTNSTTSNPEQKTLTTKVDTTVDLNNARNIKIACTSTSSSGYAQLTALTINFSCENNYEDERYYSTLNVLHCLDLGANQYNKFYNYRSGKKNYYASFDIEYTSATTFTLTLTATNATEVGDFSGCPFSSLSIGSTNDTGRIEDGQIKFSLYASSTWTEYTYAKVSN